MDAGDRTEQAGARATERLKRRGLLGAAAALAGAAVAKLASAGTVSAGHNTIIAYDSQTVMHLDVTNTTAGSSRISSNISGTAAFVALNNYPVGISRPDGMLGRTMYTTSNCAGVAGTCEAAAGGIGVMGAAKSTTGAGVYGFAGSVVPSTLPPEGTGVYGSGPSQGVVGRSTNGYGIFGESTNNHGVYGATSGGAGQAGVAGVANNTFAVSGVASNYTGMLGQTNGSGYGVAGIANHANSGAGVFGRADVNFVYGVRGEAPYTAIFGESTGAGALAGYGVAGMSAGSAGVYASSASASSYALVANSPAGLAGLFQGNVLIQGSYTATGAKSAAVPHPDGTHRRMYCQESPEPWFEDFGEAQLANGRASVELDADFAAVVHGNAYHVFLTEYDDHNALFVTRRGPRGFEVRAKSSPTASGRFGYRVVAKRKDIPGPRLERVNVPQAPPPPRAPRAVKLDLPARPEIPVLPVVPLPPGQVPGEG
jgi:hypothetical protein